MLDQSTEGDAFCARAEWRNASPGFLAGDALARRFERPRDAAMIAPSIEWYLFAATSKRSVPPALCNWTVDLLGRYFATTSADDGRLRAAFAVVGVQRHPLNLGVFARLRLQDGKLQRRSAAARLARHLAPGTGAFASGHPRAAAPTDPGSAFEKNGANAA